jgi:hypothetical protein
MKTDKRETQENTHNQDNDLETIRYYRGTWQNFFDYWKKRGVETDPYRGTQMLYPTIKKQTDSTLPIQDFGTYDKSELNKRLTESFEDFLNESKEI